MRSYLFLRIILSFAFTILVFYISQYILYIKKDSVFRYNKYQEIKHIEIKKPPSFIAHLGSLHLSSKTYETDQIIFNNLSQNKI